MKSFTGAVPFSLGQFENPLPFFMFYQDMLIKVPGMRAPKFPEHLEALGDMYWRCRTMVPGAVDLYCYVSAKMQPMGANASFSRPGWHIDGYLTTDETFIWSDSFPTLYSTAQFHLSEDHEKSLEEMEVQALGGFGVVRAMPAGELVHISRECVHRIQIPDVPHTRAFVKFSFSERRFNLRGNAINPVLPAPWSFAPRNSNRNDPST